MLHYHCKNPLCGEELTAYERKVLDGYCLFCYELRTLETGEEILIPMYIESIEPELDFNH